MFNASSNLYVSLGHTYDEKKLAENKARHGASHLALLAGGSIHTRSMHMDLFCFGRKWSR